MLFMDCIQGIVYVGVARWHWGHFLVFPMEIPRRYPRSQLMRSLLKDSSVERQGTTECIAACYVLHDVTHELVSQKNTEKFPQHLSINANIN